VAAVGGVAILAMEGVVFPNFSCNIFTYAQLDKYW